MCKRCSQKQNQINIYSIVPPLNSNCDKTLEEIESLKQRLYCVESKIPLSLYNQYMGIIRSLINLKNYCKYNLDPIIQLLNEYNC